MTAIRVGSGNYVYEVVEGWGKLPEGWRLVDVVGVGVDSHDNVFVCTRGTHPIVIFDRAGKVIGSFGDGEFRRPHGFCVGPDDAVYVADDIGQTVKKFSPDGRLLMTLGAPDKPSDTGYDPNPKDPLRRVRWSAGPFAYPTNVVIGPGGEIFVSDGYGNARVHRFTSDGQHIRSWGDPGDGPGQFWVPHGIAVDRQGIVYVADRENSRVQLFTSNGQYLSQWSPLYRPTQVRFDEQETVFVSEFGYFAGPYPDQKSPPGASETWPHGRVTVRDRNGAILSSWGDGPDKCAPGCFFAPHGLCTDSQGALYVGEVIYSAGEAGKWVSVDCHALQKFVRVT
jgi:DNA-binding beta-propeller fold protein YncE